jgi:DNA (cytosine-5)-methyltransferase 1
MDIAKLEAAEPVSPVCTSPRALPPAPQVSAEDFLAAAARLNACSVIRNADGVIEVKFDRKPHEKVKRERKRDASSSAPPAKRVKTETAKKWEPRRLRPDDGDQAITDTFCDPGLWTGKIEAPTELPTKLNVLETFAGAGGLYFGGTGSRGNRTVEIETVTAIEIVDDPCSTYKYNHPKTNVVQIGVSRFLATARRVFNLKNDKPAECKDAETEIVDMRINPKAATAFRFIDQARAPSTTDKQFGDEVTYKEVVGKKALDWLEWRISGEEEIWQPDDDDLAAAAHKYLNSKLFGPHKFPLPGDIHVVTGGPPCQGWSGYNTQRVVSDQVEELMKHPENRLIGRFMEVCFFFKPLYILMEEVPDVASKGNVMEFICSGYEAKGYRSIVNSRLRTGLFGCPQTRDRLIMMASLESLPLPAMPEPIHSDLLSKQYPEDETAIKVAYNSDPNAYPIGMWHGRRSKTELMRSLVIGDSLSCDLPMYGMAFGQHAGNRNKEEEEASNYAVRHECEPPTAYIAYLRQGCADKVHNHVYYALGLTDTMRCGLVPYEAEACWREMGGFKSTLKAPMMMELDDTAWAEMGSRWIRKIPQFMRAHEKASKSGKEDTIPELKKPWSLKSHRFPLVPYWCLTMKKGSDSGCYGRLPYTETHPTVHSYHKPHWHPSLVPFAPRVMTVREKARIQGFPDSFVFQGDVQKQYKQIANAVSPQLAKVLCRSILDAHLCALSEGKVSNRTTYSKELETFRDFMDNFDEKKLPKIKRHTPEKLLEVKLSPMTYEEFIIEYNTEYRTDHSIRNAKSTPFEVAEHCEKQHQWHIQEVLAVRWTKEDGKDCLEMLAKYHGFPVPEWIPLCKTQERLIAWKKFYGIHRLQIDALKCSGKRGSPGAGVADKDWVSYLTTENGVGLLKDGGYDDPVLLKAEKQFEQWKTRYDNEKKKGLIKTTNTTTKYLKEAA